MHHPGLEPGSTAWKAAILTARLMMLVNFIDEGSYIEYRYPFLIQIFIPLAILHLH